MNRPHARRSAAVLLAMFSSVAPLQAQEADLRKLLQDALYTEEVARALEKAATQYEALLAQYADQRPFAASALFRLAEVRRKQDRKPEAIQLYQRLIREFPGAETEVKLAGENLAAMGGEVPAAGVPADDEETKQLLYYKAQLNAAPDLVKAPQAMENAAGSGHLRLVAFLIDSGNNPYHSDALDRAAGEGRLDVCRLILEKSGNPPEEIANKAFATALFRERFEVAKFFLEKGFKPDLSGLLVATSSEQPHLWRRSITEFLVKAGADLNRMPAETFPPFSNNYPAGTPLHDALARNIPEAALFLLDQGCKPDLPTPDRGITPLHIALILNPADSAIVRRLLDAGADPNRRLQKLEERPPGDGSGGIWVERSPLEIAISTSSIENFKLLLKAGAKVDSVNTWQFAADSKNDQFLDLLVAAEAQPPVQELLGIALKTGNVPLAIRMLDAGASPSVPGLLDLAVQSDRQVEMVKLLLDRGVVPTPEWSSRWSASNLQGMGALLADRVLVPQLLEKPAISFFSLMQSPPLVKELVSRLGSAPPPSLPELFLAEKKLSWPMLRTSNGEKVVNYLTLWRKDGKGMPFSISILLDGREPLPELQWGDAIELDVERNADYQPLQPYSEFSKTLPPEIAWALKRRISFPVSLEIGGVLQELTLRGDRLIHDPTSNEVPLCTAGALASLRWQPEIRLEDTGTTLTITRKDWPDVRLPFGSREAALFELRSGDLLKLEIPPKTLETIKELRKYYIGFRAAGIPYAQMFLRTTGSGESLAYPVPLQPTLLQLIAETQPLPQAWKQFSELSSGSLLTDIGSFEPIQSVLPHPDFSRIKILRLKEDGSEETIEVNLSKWIEEAGENASVEEVKKRDIQLQLGDIVELQVHTDRLGQPWKGIAASEESFLAKALRGRVQIIGSDSQMRLEEILFKAPNFVETEAGWLPVPANSGVQSASATSLVGAFSSLTVTRGGTSFDISQGATAFLQDGDQLKNLVLISQPALTQPPPGWPQIRPRVVTPPSPSR